MTATLPKVQLRTKLPDAAMKRWAGKHVSDEQIAIEVARDAEVYMPDGRLLVRLRRGLVSAEAAELAAPHLEFAARRYRSSNRGTYAGAPKIGKKKGSKTVRSFHEDGRQLMVESLVAGYFEPQGGRNPYCRATAFTRHEVERWGEILPMVREVAGHFRREIPDRAARQAEFAESCSGDFRISGTPFSTITINKNVIGAVHQDRGDYKAGFGVIGCLRRGGEYSGGKLVFPQYGVGIDFRDRDLVFFDPHEWHAVTPMVHADPASPGVRLTVVYYFRTGLKKCGAASEELAKARGTGTL